MWWPKPEPPTSQLVRFVVQQPPESSAESLQSAVKPRLIPILYVTMSISYIETLPAIIHKNTSYTLSHDQMPTQEADI